MLTATLPPVPSAMRATSARATSSFDCGGQDSTPSRGHEMHGVAVAAHDAGAGRHVVGDDPVAALARELGLGVLDDVIGLGREADDEPRPAGVCVRDGRQDVGILDQAEPAAFRRSAS